MARLLFQTLAFGSVVLFAGISPAATTDSASFWIERMNQALLGAKTLRAEAELVTRDHTGSGQTLDLEWERSVNGDRERTLLEVMSPPDAAGVVYQITSTAGKPPERWTYLPSLRRLRKLVGFQWTDSFLGTEFTYEDVEVGAPVERANGTVRRKQRAGRELIEVTSAPYGSYSKVVTEIDPKTALPVRVSLFDVSGEPWKTVKYEWVAGREHPLPNRIEVEDLQSQAKSSLTFRAVATDVDTSLSGFSESEIDRRLAKPSAVAR